MWRLFRRRATHSAAALRVPPILPLFTRIRPGIDNVRADVWLSPQLRATTRAFAQDLLTRVARAEALVPAVMAENRGADPAARGVARAAIQGFLRASIQSAAQQQNPELALLAHVALIQSISADLHTLFKTFSAALRSDVHGERLHARPAAASQASQAVRQHSARASVLRRAGEEIHQLLRDIESDSLARTRAAQLGDEATEAFAAFDSKLLFCDPNDHQLLCNDYVLLGRYERDRDRYDNVFAAVFEFVRSVAPEALAGASDLSVGLRQAIAAGGNAAELLGRGRPAGEQRRRARLWLKLLREREIFWLAAAAYETAALSPHYGRVLNLQQIKYALVNARDLERTADYLRGNGVPAAPLEAARARLQSLAQRVRQQTGERFFLDFCAYTRDLERRRQVLAIGRQVHLVSSDTARDLSAVNGTLYEFLLPEEKTRRERRIVSHTVLKADVRDSTALVQAMADRGLNPASHFSRNLFEPLNRVLAQYSAEKVFVEGDAVILALHEHQMEPAPTVARAGALARHLLSLVTASNAESLAQGLPRLELGIGIAFANVQPQFLFDGPARIMISPALNQSDRLSACAAAVKSMFAGEGSFRVLLFETAERRELLAYNIGGIRLDAAAAERLRREVAGQVVQLTAAFPWGAPQRMEFWLGHAPLASGTVVPLLLRQGKSARLRGVAYEGEGATSYYELCSDSGLYEQLEPAPPARASTGRIQPDPAPALRFAAR